MGARVCEFQTHPPSCAHRSGPTGAVCLGVSGRRVLGAGAVRR